jgi:hypothetical protein
MAISVTEYVKVDPHTFEATGAFDAILDVDSRLFIDPHLLRVTDASELQQSYTKVTKRFTDVLHVLQNSKSGTDVFWRQANRLFSFPEVKGLCIGYSSAGTSGSGMGLQLRAQILKTAKEIVDAGITDPEIFELIGLLEEGIGADRISDMVGRLILEDLLTYSERIFSQLNVKGITFKYEDRTFKIPANPFNAQPIVLLPRDILRDLPIARSWDDIDRVCAYNERLRSKVNRIIGHTWKAATRLRKHQLRQVLVNEPEVLRDLIQCYKEKPAARYDFTTDPSGEVIWYNASRDHASRFPLPLQLPAPPSLDDVHRAVIEICNGFKDLIENNNLSALLYCDHRNPKHESAAQLLFFGIADAHCKANNLDLSPEANSGRGPVDFKVSSGYDCRVVVETKLTTNGRLIHGFETQLAEYQKAENTNKSAYVVIDVLGGSKIRVNRLKRLIRENTDTGIRVPDVVFVNAIPKASASKYRPSSTTGHNSEE